MEDNLTRCRLSFKTSIEQPGLCGYTPPKYIINGLEALMNMSTIVQNEDSKLNISDAISSPASRMRFCEVDYDGLLNLFTDIPEKNVYPGQPFNISFINSTGTNRTSSTNHSFLGEIL